jgi:hypothetical protein
MGHAGESLTFLGLFFGWYPSRIRVACVPLRAGRQARSLRMDCPEERQFQEAMKTVGIEAQGDCHRP